MQKLWKEQGRLVVWGLLLSLFAAPLWAGELEQRELFDGMVSLQMPPQFAKTDEQAIEGAQMLEFKGEDEQLLVGFILGSQKLMEMYSLETLHEDLVNNSGMAVAWLRDEWAGEGSERYFIIGGEMPSDNVAGGRSQMQTFATAVEGYFLLVIIEYVPEGGWPEVADQIIGSVEVRR